MTLFSCLKIPSYKSFRISRDCFVTVAIVLHDFFILERKTHIRGRFTFPVSLETVATGTSHLKKGSAPAMKEDLTQREDGRSSCRWWRSRTVARRRRWTDIQTHRGSCIDPARRDDPLGGLPPWQDTPPLPGLPTYGTAHTGFLP